MSKRSRKPSLKLKENLETDTRGKKIIIIILIASASNNLNSCLEMDSLLHSETKKQKLCQTDKDSTFIIEFYVT